MTLPVWAYFKVAGCVIQAVAVDVVDFFAPKNRASNRLFGNNDVLEDISLPVGPVVRGLQHFTVALFDDLARAVKATRARPRAESGNVLSEVRREVGDSAIQALQFHWPWHRRYRVEGDEVVSPTQATPEVNSGAVRHLALADWPRGLVLLGEGLPALPQAVAARRTEPWTRLLVLDSLKAAPAPSTFHADILAQPDGNHFSHGGRK